MVYESIKNSEVCYMEELQVAATETSSGDLTHRIHCPVFLFVPRKHGPENVWSIDVTTIKLSTDPDEQQ